MSSLPQEQQKLAALERTLVAQWVQNILTWSGRHSIAIPAILDIELPVPVSPDSCARRDS